MTALDLPGGLRESLVTGGAIDLERVAAYLATAKNIDEVREIRDKAQAIEAYQRKRKVSLQAQLDAAEIALRAERRLGELCKEVTGGKAGGRNAKAKLHDVTLLSDLDIDKAQSSRWQKLAKIPPKQFDKAIKTARDHERLTTAGVLREASPPSERSEPKWVHSRAHVRLWTVLRTEMDAWQNGGELEELRMVLKLAMLECEQRLKQGK